MVVFGPDTLNCEVAILENSSGRQNLLGGVGRANAVDLAYLPEFLLCARTQIRLGGGCCPRGVKSDVVLGWYSDWIYNQYRARTNLSSREFAAALRKRPRRTRPRAPRVSRAPRASLAT
jgi:hypothetical protein